MSREQIIKIAMVICAVVVLCAVIITSTGMFGGSGIGSYANAEKYTAGDTEITEKVKNIEINWTSGKVNIAYHAEETVTLHESAKGSLNEDQKMRWWLDGETLRIQFSKPGIRFGMPEKELTVTIPEGLELGDAAISLTSGDLNIPALKADTVELSATSGRIIAFAQASKIRVNTTSGDQELNWTGSSDTIIADTTSGTIRLQAENAEKISANSTSGTITLKAKTVNTVSVSSTSGMVEVQVSENKETDASCISGSVNVALGRMERLRVSTTSGSVTAALPAEPGFKADINTVSGGFNSSLALTKHGNTYSIGDESGNVNISTVSGSIRIEAAESSFGEE